MTRRRWVCPECNTGALGPDRPRKNATVRYCLTCSAKSKTLVERYCPAHETKRARKAEAQAATAARRAQKRAETRAAEKAAKAQKKQHQVFTGDPTWLPYMVDGIDTLRLWAKICRYLGVDRPPLSYGTARSVGLYGVTVARKRGTGCQLYSVIWVACLYARRYRHRFPRLRERHGRRPELNQLAGSVAVDVLGLDREKVYAAVADSRSVTWGILTDADVMRLRDLPALAKALSKQSPSARALTQRACLDEHGLVLLDREIHEGAR